MQSTKASSVHLKPVKNATYTFIGYMKARLLKQFTKVTKQRKKNFSQKVLFLQMAKQPFQSIYVRCGCKLRLKWLLMWHFWNVLFLSALAEGAKNRSTLSHLPVGIRLKTQHLWPRVFLWAQLTPLIHTSHQIWHTHCYIKPQMWMCLKEQSRLCEQMSLTYCSIHRPGLTVHKMKCLSI